MTEESNPVVEQDDDYTPFPEFELVALAEHFENIGKAWAPNTMLGGKLRRECQDRAAVCRNAIKSYTALRERALIAEHQLDQCNAAASTARTD